MSTLSSFEAGYPKCRASEFFVLRKFLIWALPVYEGDLPSYNPTVDLLLYATASYLPHIWLSTYFLIKSYRLFTRSWQWIHRFLYVIFDSVCFSNLNFYYFVVICVLRSSSDLHSGMLSMYSTWQPCILHTWSAWIRPTIVSVHT